MTENETLPQDSFLVADCGATTTTVVLFDVVDGSYRLLARASSPTTAMPPWSDVLVGVQQAITQISETTGRPLLTEDGFLIQPGEETGAGVDYFAATASAGRPLKTIIAGLLDDVSVASARRALHTIYADEVDCFSLSDNRDEQTQIGAILESEPDLILLTGGTDGGDDRRLLKLAETVEMGISLFSGPRTVQVVFAGNRAMREPITGLLGGAGTLHVANNVRPNLDTEQLGEAMQLVGELYSELKIGAIPSIAEVSEWSQYPILPTARAFGGIIEYFAALYKGRVMGVDLGSASTTLVAADPDDVKLAVRSDLGMGRPLPQVLSLVDAPAVTAWVPVTAEANVLQDFARNKALHPQTVPMTEDELYLEQALARQILRRATADAARRWNWPDLDTNGLPPVKFMVLRGNTLAGAPRPGQAVLMMLDALQPTGIFSLAVDKYGVLSALGLLAPYEPLLAVQVLEGGALVDLGWVIAPAGRGDPGTKAMRVVVDSETRGRLEIDVQYGSLEVLPLPPGAEAELTLRPERNCDVGFGPGKGKQVTIHGGAVGLVIDARGRPLSLPEDEGERQETVRQWHWDMGG